jgi:hypothetical protein
MSFNITNPTLNLAETDLAINSPMSFNITNPPLNLAETDLAINSPMSFNITNPPLNLAETDLAINSPMSFNITQECWPVFCMALPNIYDDILFKLIKRKYQVWMPQVPYLFLYQNEHNLIKTSIST